MKKNQNKGLSLVELLIALAVSSIILSAVVALISQGLKGYQRQTLTARLQEDADIAMNQISDSIMEATSIDISNYDSNKKTTESFQVSSTRKYEYDDSDQTLKIYSASGSGGTTGTGSILCQNVSDFKVQVLQSSVETQTNAGTGIQWIKKIRNPVQIRVTIEVSEGGITRCISRVTGMRNTIDTMTLGGYGVGGFPDSDVLTIYGFLVD